VREGRMSALRRRSRARTAPSTAATRHGLGTRTYAGAMTDTPSAAAATGATSIGTGASSTQERRGWWPRNVRAGSRPRTRRSTGRCTRSRRRRRGGCGSRSRSGRGREAVDEAHGRSVRKVHRRDDRRAGAAGSAAVPSLGECVQQLGVHAVKRARLDFRLVVQLPALVEQLGDELFGGSNGREGYQPPPAVVRDLLGRPSCTTTVSSLLPSDRTDRGRGHQVGVVLRDELRCVTRRHHTQIGRHRLHSRRCEWRPVVNFG
jgi:hypothetical protein